MKTAAYILSFIVVALTAAPCLDEPQDNTLAQTEISQHPSHNHANEADHCSPFCTCMCCASPVIYTAGNFSISLLSFVTRNFVVYKSDFDPAPSSSIWQPPKLS
jgi:hypothetical protein